MMPWKETNKMEQKELFIKEMLKYELLLFFLA